MAKIKVKKIIISFALAFLLFSAIIPVGNFRTYANPSAQREVVVTTADVVYADKSEEVVDVSDENVQIEYKLDIEIDKKTAITEMQESFDEVKEEYQQQIIDGKKTLTYFDGNVEDVVEQYNGLYRKGLKKYTKENFELNFLFDISVNQATLDQLEIQDTFVRVRLDFGGGQSKSDPLPIILYKCDGETTWDHFDLIRNETENRNWAERTEDGKVVLNFYKFCPLMVLEPIAENTESCQSFPWWIILIVILVLLVTVTVMLTTEKNDKRKENAESNKNEAKEEKNEK